MTHHRNELPVRTTAGVGCIAILLYLAFVFAMVAGVALIIKWVFF